jgi:superfamily II DNA or RNA helicase
VQPVLVGPPEHLGAKLICTPLEAYEDHAPDSRAIIFCASVEHVRQTTAAFNAAGIAAEGIVADTDRATRRSMRERLTAGTTRVLVGCGVFLEGFDCAAIDCVILARSFSTVGSYLQAIGRGLRPCAATFKRSCTVLDLAGSAHQCGFGLPDEDRTWSLDGDASRRTEPLPALSRCTECMAIFRPAMSCPRCGAVRAALARVPRVLNRAERLQRIEHIPLAARDAAYLRKLQHVATSRMRLTGRFAEQWAARAFEKRFHRAPAMDVSTAHGSTHRAPAAGGTA